MAFLLLLYMRVLQVFLPDETYTTQNATAVPAFNLRYIQNLAEGGQVNQERVFLIALTRSQHSTLIVRKLAKSAAIPCSKFCAVNPGGRGEQSSTCVRSS